MGMDRQCTSGRSPVRCLVVYLRMLLLFDRLEDLDFRDAASSSEMVGRYITSSPADEEEEADDDCCSSSFSLLSVTAAL